MLRTTPSIPRRAAAFAEPQSPGALLGFFAGKKGTDASFGFFGAFFGWSSHSNTLLLLLNLLVPVLERNSRLHFKLGTL
jgi:hypothetical protein